MVNLAEGASADEKSKQSDANLTGGWGERIKVIFLYNYYLYLIFKYKYYNLF